MKFFFTILTIFCTFFLNAQNDFEKGYFIDNTGIRTDCLIKNNDWKNNPTYFDFKLAESNSAVSRKNISEVKEFAILDKSKFVKETVAIDQSSQNLYGLTSTPDPLFKEQTVFLKVLVEGESNLYYYENKDFERYFYSKNNKIEQLIYKKYSGEDGNTFYNDRFKQQLFINFTCSPQDKDKILKLRYNDDDLMNYFIETNNCKGGKTTATEVSKKRQFKTNFKLNLLVNSINTNFKIQDNAFENTEIKNSTGNISIGFETEILLSYNNNNWSVIFDPSYTSFDDSFTLVYKPGYINPDENIKTKNFIIRIPLGLRRYLHISENHKLFFNASIGLNIVKSDVEINENSFTSNSVAFNLPLGVGYQFKKYNVELKYFTNTSLTEDAFAEEGNKYVFGQISLKLSYQLF